VAVVGREKGCDCVVDRCAYRGELRALTYRMREAEWCANRQTHAINTARNQRAWRPHLLRATHRNGEDRYATAQRQQRNAVTEFADAPVS
jgi:hypothetical protein